MGCDKALYPAQLVHLRVSLALRRVKLDLGGSDGFVT
jgi:hypothetical protein